MFGASAGTDSASAPDLHRVRGLCDRWGRADPARTFAPWESVVAFSVDAAGAITSVKTFNAEVEKTPASAKKAGDSLSWLESQAKLVGAGLVAGLGVEAFRLLFIGLFRSVFGLAIRLVRRR